jgi:hypothetical protein
MNDVSKKLRITMKLTIDNNVPIAPCATLVSASSKSIFTPEWTKNTSQLDMSTVSWGDFRAW